MAYLRSCLIAIGFLAMVPVAPRPAAGGQAKQGTVTVVLQNGLDGYSGATDDGRDGVLKLMDDKKATDPRWPNPNYRHLIKFADLEKAILGGNVKVTSATFSMLYYDEFWSVNVYHIAAQRSVDGTLDNAAAEPEDTAVVHGDRFKEGEKTPRPSWVAWKLRPETVEGWLKDPAANHGLVLRGASRDFSRGDQGNYGIWFRGCGFGTARERPKLTLTYAFTGNLPPRAPTWDFRYRGATLGREHTLRWRMPAPPDADGDSVVYDVEWRRGNADWQPVAKGLAQAQQVWNTAELPLADGHRLRVRARDPEEATSAWVESDGEFRLTRDDVAYQIGVATPIEKLRRDVPFDGAFGTSLHIELARNEYEGAQLVVANVNRELRGLTIEPSDLRSDKGAIPKANVSVRQVGYVSTVSPDKYSVPYVGLWPDPLLELPQVDVPVGKVQPLWVTVYAPKDAPAGEYGGTLLLKAQGVAPTAVALKVTVWDFALPTPGRFRAMVVDGGRSQPFYDRLLANRLSPGYVLLGWDWDRPRPPVALKDGKWDFAEADRLADYCLARGLNIFTMARFPKPGKFGFPKEYSADYRARFKEFLAAYAAHLREKGWLKMAHVYNIDEAPPAQWEACKENYQLVKSVAPDVAVMQCLNEPKGVAALAGFADIWDVYVGQFHQSGASARLKAGNDVIWAVCCYPATHPNLFIDYPAMDARILGWLSWKNGVSGFEYWAANSWGDNLKRLGDKPYITTVEVESWKANTFGTYNGDGYLVYPGPNGAVLSSVRLECLRDGIEDYEMLAVLRERVSAAKAKGADVSAAERLLAIGDAICRADLTQSPPAWVYPSDPQKLLDSRGQIAQAISRLAH